MRLRPAASPRATELTLPRKPLWSSLRNAVGARAELYTPTLSPASSEASFSVPPPGGSTEAGSVEAVSAAGGSATGALAPLTTMRTELRREDAAIRIQCAFWAWQSGREAECPMPHGWEAVTAEDGRVYYWNPTTDETSWTLPHEGPDDCASGQGPNDCRSGDDCMGREAAAPEGSRESETELRRVELPRAPDPSPLCALPAAKPAKSRPTLTAAVPPTRAGDSPPSTSGDPPPTAAVGRHCPSVPNPLPDPHPDPHPHPHPHPSPHSPQTAVRGRRTSVRETKNELHTLRNSRSVSAFDNSKLERVIGGPTAGRRSQFSRSAGGWELRTHKASAAYLLT